MGSRKICPGFEKYAVSGLKLKSIWLVRFDAIKDSKGRLKLQMTNTRLLKFGGGLCPSSARSFKDCARLVLQCQNNIKS